MTDLQVLMLLLCVFIPFSSTNRITRFEFEDTVGGPGFARSPWRSNASNASSLRMFEGDSVQLNLCVTDTLMLNLTEFLYSNDGPSDMINFRLDNGQIVDTVTTKETVDGFGKHWDLFKSHIFSDIGAKLESGNYSLEIQVQQSDCYGTEFDALDFLTDIAVTNKSFFCGSKLIRSANPSSCALTIDATTKPPTNSTSMMTQSTSATSNQVTELSSSSAAQLQQSSETVQTSKESTMKPSTPSSAAMQSTSTEDMTMIKKDEKFVEQVSYPNGCLMKKNIKLRFKPLSLEGIQIIARADSDKRFPVRRQLEIENEPNLCRNKIWQIGEFNEDHEELGPLRYTNIDYDVNLAGGSQMPFPGLVKQQYTRTIKLRYVVPRDVNIGTGSVYLTLGLVNATENTPVGMQYHIRRKKKPSKPEYVTLTPENNVVGWDLPARSVSPSLENIITLYLNGSSQSPLKIDFLRLESASQKHKVKQVKIARNKQWRIKGFTYKSKRAPNGMKVRVDGGKTFDKVERIVIYYKTSRKSLTIYGNGEIFPMHQRRMKKDDSDGTTFSDITGFLFGNPKTDITAVDFDSEKSILKVTYIDGTFIRFTLKYTKPHTKLVVVKSTIKSPEIEFISTYINENIAAVNKIAVDKANYLGITDKGVEKTKGQQYRFIKTTPSKLYDASNQYELLFPQRTLPM